MCSRQKTRIAPIEAPRLTMSLHGWYRQCSIYHLHACTYAGDFDSVQVTFHNVPTHVHVDFSPKSDSWGHKDTPKSKQISDVNIPYEMMAIFTFQSVKKMISFRHKWSTNRTQVTSTLCW